MFSLSGSGKIWRTRTPNLTIILNGDERERDPTFSSRSDVLGPVYVWFAFELRTREKSVNPYCGGTSSSVESDALRIRQAAPWGPFADSVTSSPHVSSCSAPRQTAG